ncbi:MAG: hypothetical protein N2255_07550, partial [Kiritimatiellae bacterium]|nr:hypothetical protein [Kiritimatiellia bacterium]
MRNAKSDFPVGMPQHSGPGYRTALVLIGCCVLCWIVGIRTPELTGVVVRLAADRTMFLWPFPARVILFGVCCGVLSVRAGLVTRLALAKARNEPDGHPSIAYV